MKFIVRHPSYTKQWKTEIITKEEIGKTLNLSKDDLEKTIQALVHTGAIVEAKEPINQTKK